MKWCGKTWVGAVTCLALVAASQAANDNPYQKIVVRNIFGLKPQEVAPPPPPPSVPTPKLTLQGITSILGRKQVLFKRNTISLPGQPATEKAYILSEGQREDDVEVVSVDVDAGTVKFNNNGVIQLLDMKNNAAKAPAGTGAVPAPAAPPTPIVRNNPNAPGNELRRIPRTGHPEGEEAPAAAPSDPNAATTPETAPVEPVAPAIDPMEAQVPKNAQGQALSSEEQSILIELERERTKPLVETGESAPLPMTEITPPGSVGMPDPATEAPVANP